MSKRRQPEHPEGNAEESASADDAPLKRFKALARRLSKVPREAVVKEQRAYEIERMAKKERDS